MAYPVFCDKKLEVYDDFLLIKDYHAPGFHKKVLLSEIESVEVEKLTMGTGKYRLWGTGWFSYWMPFHWRRETKDKVLIFRLRKGWTKNIFVTLDSKDPLEACKIIQNLN